MNHNSWLKNPALNHIDPDKLQMLASLADQAQGKNQNELFSFLMSLSSHNSATAPSFDASEMDAIINVLKTGKSPQEIQRIDKLCALMKQFRR